MQKRIHELKAGDIVREHGGRFRIIADAFECLAARPLCAHLKFGDGPADTAGAKAICLDGEVPGYFKPGSDWYFQGNFNAPMVHVEQ